VDFKTGRKETRWQPDGQVDVLVNNVCDLYPVFDKDDPNLITDVEILDDPDEELLDRAMFAVVKQRGNDPVEPDDGIQWAEAVLGEVLPPIILQQVNSSVSKEGRGVRATFDTVKNNSKEYLAFKVELIG